MKQEKFSIKRRIKSFKYAYNGIRILLHDEHNARIHLFAALLVIVAGVFFNISIYEWSNILLAIILVFSMEMINSALENLADFCTQENNVLIKKAKDLAAGAVLVSVFYALFVGAYIFIPKIYTMWFK